MWVIYEGWREEYKKNRIKELKRQAQLNAQYKNISELKPSNKQLMITQFIDKNGDYIK
jgi:hypothetical protein